MTDHALKLQLKQLLKQGYSELDLIQLDMAPEHLLKVAMEEFAAEERSTSQVLNSQHNQASFAMRLGC